MPRERKYAIGLDLGGTKTLTALFDRKRRLLAEAKTKTRPLKGKAFFSSMLQESIRQVMDEAGADASEIAAVGAGCAGLIDERKGVVLDSPNLPFLRGYPLAKQLRKMTGSPAAAVGNDVQTGLYGEFRLGAAKGYRNVIGVFLGTGVGGALIINGKPYRGSAGTAGEVGHLAMDPLGPICGCGKRGCLEAFAGRHVIAAEAAALACRDQAPHLLAETGTDFSRIKSSALARAIAAGDREVEELIRGKARLVGVAIANLVNILGPELVVLGGGLVEAMPSLIVREAESSMRERAMKSIVKSVKLVAAKLGDHSIVVGAAERAWEAAGLS